MGGGFNAISGTDDHKVLRGFVLEMLLTFMLVLAVFATLDPKHGKESNGPLAIGMTVGVVHLMAVPITGCGTNPARSLGPALIASSGEANKTLWVFVHAPMSGAQLAALAYMLWFAERDKFREESKTQVQPIEHS